MGEVASVSVEAHGGLLYVQDLRGSDAVALRRLARVIQRISTHQAVYVPIGEGEVYDKLRRVIGRLGFQKYIEVWRANGE